MNETHECRCAWCEVIHWDFICTFGKWPAMTHGEALDLERQRARNEARWARLMEDR